jgi:hypothetical protein
MSVDETVAEGDFTDIPDEEDTSFLSKQDLSKLDVSTLTPLTPEIISRQATINIGLILVFFSLVISFVTNFRNHWSCSPR